jgi:transcriptional regulator with XRE-family HTH domain
MIISTRIRDIRHQYGISLHELSEKAGISIQQLSRLELGNIAATAYQEQQLFTAVAQLITDRRAAMDQLELELVQCSGQLLRPTEVTQNDP